jgi:hypothetical protein
MYVAFVQSKSVADVQVFSKASFSINLQPFRQNLNDITGHLEKHRKIVQSHVEHAERLLSKQDRDKAAETRADLELKYHTDRQREAEITFCKGNSSYLEIILTPTRYKGRKISNSFGCPSLLGKA